MAANRAPISSRGELVMAKMAQYILKTSLAVTGSTVVERPFEARNQTEALTVAEKVLINRRVVGYVYTRNGTRAIGSVYIVEYAGTDENSGLSFSVVAKDRADLDQRLQQEHPNETPIKIEDPATYFNP